MFLTIEALFAHVCVTKLYDLLVLLLVTGIAPITQIAATPVDCPPVNWIEKAALFGLI
jgi:hypothetical protein